MIAAFPATQRARDEWILARRAPRAPSDPNRAHAFFVEDERSETGEIVPVATVFLTNRECPWRCLMCDLWKHTLPETVAPGVIPAQIDHAFHALAREHGEPLSARQLKLYNSGSFFDPRAIPPADHPAIAERTRGFERVIVECHPALVNERCVEFRDQVAGQLEVAMGLETAHPEVLAALNKRMTLDDFARAADFLRQNAIALRVFILLRPPFLDEAQALYWAKRSIDFAFSCGATAASLIPTRPGNGALDELAARGEFAPPTLATVEAAAEYGVGLRQGRVFTDLWDIGRIATCPLCGPARVERLRRANLNQVLDPPVPCSCE